METTPSVLQWLLDHRPQGFPLITLPLWQIISSFLKLIRASSNSWYSNLGTFMHLLTPMVEATAALSTAYLLYLESCTANRAVVQPVGRCIIGCRLEVMAIVANTTMPDTPAKLPMLSNRAVQELAICMLVSFCQAQHAEHARRQQQQQQQHGGRRRQSRNSRSTTTTVSSFSSSSTFADVVLPPDHELVTVAGGQFAVALHAKLVVRHMPAKPGFDANAQLAMGYFFHVMRAGMEDSTGTMVSGIAAGALLLTKPSTQQVLLELIVLFWSAGAQIEGLKCVDLLWQCWDHAQAEDVGALVAARGPLLLQVLYLALKEGWAAQQQGLFASEVQDGHPLNTVITCLATMGECKFTSRLWLGVHSRVILSGHVVGICDFLCVQNGVTIEVCRNSPEYTLHVYATPNLACLPPRQARAEHPGESATFKVSKT